MAAVRVKYFIVWDPKRLVWDIFEKNTMVIKGLMPVIIGSITQEELSEAIDGIFQFQKKVKALADLILISQSQKFWFVLTYPQAGSIW